METESQKTLNIYDIKNSDSITKTLVNHLIVSSFEIR